MACPLRAKCWWGRRNTYQWSLGGKYLGRYLGLDVDADWHRRHGTRLGQLLQVFVPEKRRRKRTPEQRERDTASQRESRRRRTEEMEQEVKVLPKRQPLPCGEDCEGGCPYDGPERCPYTDADLDAAEAEAKREHQRKLRRAQYERHLEKMATDPVYAANFRKKNAARCKRYYNKKHGGKTDGKSGTAQSATGQ